MTRTSHRLLGIVVGLLAAQACDHCNDPPEEDFACDRCDVVVMMRRTDGFQNRTWTIPPKAEAACEGVEVRDGLVETWEAETCWQESANYLVHVIDWDDEGTIEAGFRRETEGTFACPETAQAGGGCNGHNVVDPGDRIVGPYDVCSEQRTAVAALVDSSALANPNETALAQDLAVLLSATDTDTIPLPMVVFTPSAATAFLISPRHVLTVAHVISPIPSACGGTETDRLDTTTLLFDYRTTPEAATAVTGMTVIACGRNDADDIRMETDWAVIELDEPLLDREPLELPPAGYTPTPCRTVYTLGHPLGHPQQCVGTKLLSRPTAWVIDDDDRVHDPAFPRESTFTTSLDVVHSLSGAPVFDRETNTLIGLHRQGPYDTGDGALRSPAAECVPLSDCGVELNLGTLSAELTAIIAD